MLSTEKQGMRPAPVLAVILLNVQRGMQVLEKLAAYGAVALPSVGALLPLWFSAPFGAHPASHAHMEELSIYAYLLLIISALHSHPSDCLKLPE